MGRSYPRARPDSLCHLTLQFPPGKPGNLSFLLCIPYYSLSADPESLLQNIREHAQRQEQVDPLEPTEDIPEETAEPTIPPEANPYTKFDFQYGKHNYLYCTRQDSYPGIDVSSFQGKINWKKVKDSGIRYAMIRLGYRGYGQAGNMVEDEYARFTFRYAAPR